MIHKLILALLFIALIFIPVAVSASELEKDVWLEEAIVISGIDKQSALPGKLLELNEGTEIRLSLKLHKNSNAKGTITLASDLVRFEGSTKLLVEEYPDSVIEINCSGTVPDALIKDGKTIKYGDSDFVLANILLDRDGFTQTIASFARLVY